MPECSFQETDLIDSEWRLNAEMRGGWRTQTPGGRTKPLVYGLGQLSSGPALTLQNTSPDVFQTYWNLLPWGFSPMLSSSSKQLIRSQIACSLRGVLVKSFSSFDDTSSDVLHSLGAPVPIPRLPTSWLRGAAQLRWLAGVGSPCLCAQVLPLQAWRRGSVTQPPGEALSSGSQLTVPGAASR